MDGEDLWTLEVSVIVYGKILIVYGNVSVVCGNILIVYGNIPDLSNLCCFVALGVRLQA